MNVSETNSQDLPRRLVYAAGLTITLAAVGVLLSSSGETFLSPGPANPGHESLSCGDCHLPAKGTTRQQVQANVQHWIGAREGGADFQTKAINNRACQACHANQGDVHPPYRFEELRFADLREILGPDNCVSCHREHSGRRITVQREFCAHCHQDVSLKDDPVKPSHTELAATGHWDSCLRCHDYHGNHQRKTPTELGSAATNEQVKSYLKDGSSPYGDDIRFPAKQERP